MSVWKVLLGFLLLFCGIFILGCTEVFTIRSGNTLESVTSNIVHIDNIDNIDSKNDGKLIHINGTATTEETLMDDIFKRQYNALCLMRNIYYYQWNEVEEREEYKDKDGNTKTKYSTEHYIGWYSQPINSEEFTYKRYHNIAPLRLLNDTVYAENVHVGGYLLDSKQKEAIINMEPADIEYDQQFIEDIRIPTERRLGKKVNVQVKDGEIFIGVGTIESPEIGDIKACLTIAKPLDVTITGQQDGNSIKAYVVDGDSVSYIKAGTTSVNEYLAKKEETNTAGTWGGRISALVFMVWGLFYIFPLITKMTSALPVLADVMRAGSIIISIALGLIISSVVIGFVWLFENPIVSLVCFGIFIASVVAIIIKGKKNKKEDFTNKSFGIDEVDIPE